MLRREFSFSLDAILNMPFWVGEAYFGALRGLAEASQDASQDHDGGSMERFFAGHPGGVVIPERR